MALAAPSPAPGAPPAGPEPDRMLAPEEATRFLGVTARWLRRHGRTLPGRVVLGTPDGRLPEARPRPVRPAGEGGSSPVAGAGA